MPLLKVADFYMFVSGDRVDERRLFNSEGARDTLVFLCCQIRGRNMNLHTESVLFGVCRWQRRIARVYIGASIMNFSRCNS